jgi:hypothetical protein
VSKLKKNIYRILRDKLRSVTIPVDPGGPWNIDQFETNGLVRLPPQRIRWIECHPLNIRNAIICTVCNTCECSHMNRRLVAATITVKLPFIWGQYL